MSDMDPEAVEALLDAMKSFFNMRQAMVLAGFTIEEANRFVLRMMITFLQQAMAS